MGIETIISLIVAAAPSLVAIISIITAVVKLIISGKANSKEVIDKFEETRQAVLNTKEYEELKKELKLAHQENRELKKKINEFLTLLDRVARNEEE